MKNGVGGRAITNSRVGDRWSWAMGVFVLVLLILGCSGGQDPVVEGIAKFPLLRDDLEEMRQLLLALGQADGITGFEVGPLYSERPDKVIFGHEKAVLYREVISAKAITHPEELERLEKLAHRIPCNSISLDAAGSFRVSNYWGRNSDLGYVFSSGFPRRFYFDGYGPSPYCEPQYHAIPGAPGWYFYKWHC